MRIVMAKDELIVFARASLEDNYLDKEECGFFDSVGCEYGLKKLFYNSVCAIGLAESDNKELFNSVVEFLIGLSHKYDGLVPTWTVSSKFTFNTQGNHRATLGEQGLLLWALSKAYNQNKNQDIFTCCNKTFNVIGMFFNEGYIPHFPGTDYYVPMTTALCLDGLLEYYSISNEEICKRMIHQTAKNLIADSNPPVFFIIDNRQLSRHIYFNNLAYSIHALSRYSLMFNDGKARAFVLETVSKLLDLQGSKGQWWWAYSPEGNVIDGYPVYSVHQLGMAVMALKMARRLAGELLRERIDTSINNSIKWVFGNNELKIPLIDYKKKLIWRCIERRRIKHNITKRFYEYFKFNNRIFNIEKKSRSYEYGWLLYALSLK